MAIIFDCACTDILIFLITITVCIYAYFKWTYQYWKRKGVPGLEPSIPFGNMPTPILNQKYFGDEFMKQYNIAKAKGYKHIGLFIMHKPAYMPIDLQYIKNIITKDFDHFMDRGIYYNEKDDPLGAHLFNIEGVKWRNLRMKLTPTFTSGKMKMMFPTLTECGKQMGDYMEKACLKDEPVDIKDVLSCFTTDVIASCAFGLDCNSFKDKNSEFRKYLRRNFVLTTPELLRMIFGSSFPNLARKLGVTLVSKDVSEFFMKIITETVEYREKNNFVRKDFMQLLLQLKNNVLETGEQHQHDGKSLTLEELAAQAFIFLLAGFETSSTTMTFCLYELAVNEDLQERVREEINTVLKEHDGKITYDAVTEMKYVGQVIEETLRKYPPVSNLNRVCKADYKIPDTDITIEKGTLVLIPVLGLQRDEDYFPDPERFDPERFSEENKRNISQFSYLPFGEGPRICIGLRFGLMQAKVGLAVLLQNYAFTLNNKTKTPLEMNPNGLVMSVLGDIWLDVKKVS
ncbi:hypothetical protein ILUMI_03244 [Ignelater luminosus]|uniref:Cytochrome P450 n=1 Tax=Ignelater luminosus TaxID=2038154 RepID=A0A8K0DEY3_IGNLU|nr:hypothetical protein ILUMI_03244 [Ignelater luminosus]